MYRSNVAMTIRVEIQNRYKIFRNTVIRQHLNGKEYAIYLKTKKKRTRHKYERKAFSRIFDICGVTFQE